MERYFDASGQVAGRLASTAAKLLLKGDSIFIINAEKAVITGDAVFIEKFYKERVDRGEPHHGPFYPREPDRMLRRMTRGMLPFHSARGREAFRRLRVYKSLPAELKGKKFEKMPQRAIGQKHVEIGFVSVKLGAKKTW
jgi:large subunit ribosomal protein L13